MGELNQFLVPCLKYTSPGCRCLGTQPRSDELGLVAQLIRPLPHSVESILKREILFASISDEVARDIKPSEFPCLEPLGIVEHEEMVFGRSETSIDVCPYRLPVRNVLVESQLS
jgi:hypothetical protein